jgi:formylglycine-generating enzyme required for sulfatase activity/tRNA A-37 threonylcarbamoyl transferase component Bud32
MPNALVKDDPLLAAAPLVEGYRVLGGVVILERIGQGAMGAVFRGHHLRLDIDVALKVLAVPRAHCEEDAQAFVQRFLREARTAASVSHQNLIRVYDVNSEAKIHYLVMDCIDGETATEALGRLSGTSATPGLSAALAATICLGAARGLGAAHAKGIVHRDVKPDNILIGADGCVVVVDLGLAKVFTDGEAADYTGITKAETVMGTPCFMAPEQFDGSRDVGPAADVWSLGITLYQMLAGKPPWEDTSIFTLAASIQNDPLPDIRSLRPDIGEELCAILDKSLRKNLAERFSDCGKFARALERYLAGCDERAQDDAQACLCAPTDVMQTAVDIPSQSIMAAISARLSKANDASSQPDSQATIVQGRPELAHEGLEVSLPGGVALAMVDVPAGRFMMGSKKGDADECPVHEVSLTKSFHMGKFPVTQAQYECLMGINPSAFQGAERPVEQVGFKEAMEFCHELSSRSDLKFRLPTEAEWEWACRARRAGSFCFGSDVEKLGDYACYTANARRSTQPVGHKKPNSWGLHDMHGNVWEWCSDLYAKDFYARSPAEDPRGPLKGEGHVARGGSWNNYEKSCRCSTRYFYSFKSNLIGFRVVAESKST